MTQTTCESETWGTGFAGDNSDQWIAAGYYDPDFNNTIRRGLDRLAALNPNWDAQGAHPIDPGVIEAARDFINGLPPNLIRSPAVVPMAKGNLQFEWHDGPRSLELEIEDSRLIHYLQWHPEKGVEEEGTFPLQDMSRAVALIGWFTRGEANV